MKAKANEIHQKLLKLKYYSMLYYEILLYFTKFCQILLNLVNLLFYLVKVLNIYDKY
jgi:hypothetical protein